MVKGLKQSILELEFAKDLVADEIKPSTTPASKNFRVIVQHKSSQAMFEASVDKTATSLRDEPAEHFGFTKPYTKLNLYYNDEKLTDGKIKSLGGKALRDKNITIGDGTVLVML